MTRLHGSHRLLLLVPNENPVPVITPFCPYQEFFKNFALRLDTSIVEPGRAGGVLLPSAPSRPVQIRGEGHERHS